MITTSSINKKHRIVNYMAWPGFINKVDTFTRSKKPEFIEMTVANYFGIDVEIFYGRDRRIAIAEARHLVMYFLRQYTHLTVTEVGKKYHRDHTAVCHAVKTVKGWMRFDEVFRKKALDIKFLLEG